MDAATAALAGTGIGLLGNALVTWINRHYDERKARRELMYKTGFDYWKTAFEAAQVIGNRNVPFEAFFLYGIELMELSEDKTLSKEQRLVKVGEARMRHDMLIKNWMETAGPKIA